jgi:hypothetical protein
MVDDRQIHPLQAMILATAAEMVGDDARFERALECVDILLDASPQSAAMMREFDLALVSGELRRWFQTGDYTRVRNHLALVRKFNPALRAAFPNDPCVIGSPLPNPQLPVQIPSFGLYDFAVPLKPSPKSRYAFFTRRFYYGPDSRHHDMGPRVARAFQRAGRAFVLMDPAYEGNVRVAVNAQRLLSLALASGADVILIDHFGIETTVGEWGAFTAALRRARPSVKLVHFNFDPWIQKAWPTLQALGQQVDLIWAHFPGGTYWDELGLRAKLFPLPFPVGVGVEELPNSAPVNRTAFHGAVESYNLSRAYWLTMLSDAKLNITQQISVHDSDGLDPIDSYRNYLTGFQNSERLLSFSMRSDGSRIITGRSFETVFSGACLIQERADDLDFYFIPGEHYFRFETIEDLTALLKELEHNPDMARQVAAKGQAYYQYHFADTLLVEKLEARLAGW